MQRIILSIATTGIILILMQGCDGIASVEYSDYRERPFNTGWKFKLDSIAGAEDPAFDDSQWHTLDLPHDWSIEDLPEPRQGDEVGPFSRQSPGGFFTGHTLGGTGWYRKHFKLKSGDRGKIITLLFDGVMQESDVWVNGTHLGYHPNGYTPFAYNITPYLNPRGRSNVIAVRVKNTGHTSRWYSGSGIYRDVNLIITDPVHIALWRVEAETLSLSEEKAEVEVNARVINESEENEGLNVEFILLDMEGNHVADHTVEKELNAGDDKQFKEVLKVKTPHAWSTGDPYLYTLEVKVRSGNELLDAYNLKTGIRTIAFNAEEGFMINGQPVLLKGGNMHHDNGILGAAAFKRAEERRVEIMKANGFNAIRCSHNPPSTHFLDACDRLGMLVIDESFDVWTQPKAPRDYHLYFNDYWEKDMEAMLLRDRNHPSVVMWSIGNEIQERADPEGLEIARKLIATIRKYDIRRPVTASFPDFMDFMGGAHDWSYSAPAFAMLDIGGYNYNWMKWDNDHELYPDRIMMTTESMPINMGRIWQKVEASPWIIGDFVWTGMDYLGESGVAHGSDEYDTISYGIQFPGMETGFGRGWPWFVAWCGDIDIIGSKKPQSYYRDVLWDRSQMEIAVHTPLPEGHREVISLWGWPSELPCWTWPGEEGRFMEVTVYSKCTSVQLELNGTFIGEQKVIMPDELAPPAGLTSMHQYVPDVPWSAKFMVPYSPGQLKAIGICDGKETASKVLTTTGEPDKLILTPRRRVIDADRQEVVFVMVEVADQEGNLVTNAEVPVTFILKGEGKLVAAGNGSPDQMASFSEPLCNTFRGRALAVLRSTGESGSIKLTTSSPGLESAVVTIAAE